MSSNHLEEVSSDLGSLLILMDSFLKIHLMTIYRLMSLDQKMIVALVAYRSICQNLLDFSVVVNKGLVVDLKRNRMSLDDYLADSVANHS